jgi:diguanylate cyclase (GGDEF)-like protein/PAS domain S-box-containing protein
VIPPLAPPNESERLAALARYHILDTEPEEAFDALTKIAMVLMDVPIALVSIVDADRQWFKSRHGLDAPQTSRDISFCGHVVQSGESLVVPDAHMDPRFCDNPLVTGEPRIRFYAGMPLRTVDGYVLGTLCAIDKVPRTLAADKLAALALLSTQVSRLLELRHVGHLLEQAHAEVQSSRRWFRMLLDNIPAMVGYWDVERHNAFANQAYSEWFGKTPAEIYGLHIRELLGDALYAKNEPFLARALAGEKVDFPRTIETPSGVRHSKTSYVPDIVGSEVRGVIVLVTDVTELETARALEQQLAQDLERLVRTDVLTGLLNRRGGAELADRESKRAARNKQLLYVAMIDIDFFKKINDSFGHAMGDKVLQHVAQTFLAEFRTEDVCARWGGEEFLIVLCGTDAEGALRALERARIRVASDTTLSCPVTISAGLVQWNPADLSLERATALADDLMYAAKTAGRNRVVTHK